MIDHTLLLRARTHISIAHHIPGRIRLRFKPSILTMLKGRDLSDGKELLGSLERFVQDVRINEAALSLIIQYDKNQLRPDWWEKLIKGSDRDAEDVFATLEQMATNNAGLPSSS